MKRVWPTLCSLMSLLPVALGILLPSSVRSATALDDPPLVLIDGPIQTRLAKDLLRTVKLSVPMKQILFSNDQHTQFDIKFTINDTHVNIIFNPQHSPTRLASVLFPDGRALTASNLSSPQQRQVLSDKLISLLFTSRSLRKNTTGDLILAAGITAERLTRLSHLPFMYDAHGPYISGYLWQLPVTINARNYRNYLADTLSDIDRHNKQSLSVQLTERMEFIEYAVTILSYKLGEIEYIKDRYKNSTTPSQVLPYDWRDVFCLNRMETRGTCDEIVRMVFGARDLQNRIANISRKVFLSVKVCVDALYITTTCDLVKHLWRTTGGSHSALEVELWGLQFCDRCIGYLVESIHHLVSMQNIYSPQFETVCQYFLRSSLEKLDNRLQKLLSSHCRSIADTRR